jgi:hypothetical protein
MKPTFLVWMAASACLIPLGARAQEVDYNDAVSRPVLLLNTELTSAQSEAVSRSVLIVTAAPADSRKAVSRAVILFNANTGVEYDDANSRQVLLYLPPYAAVDVQQALSVAAGLLSATQADVDRLNITRDGGSTSKVDMRDAARIARMAMGLDE